jgi:type 1 glutamine amidotransferase
LVVGEGEGKPRLLEKSFGTIHVDQSETDVVAWTCQNEWGGKVFATSLGHAGDFAEASFTRMLLNSVYWATNREPIPADQEVKTWDIEMEVPSKYTPRKK